MSKQLGRPKGSKNKNKRHSWSAEEVEYLRTIAGGSSYKEIIRLISEKFGHSLTAQQVKSALRRYGIQIRQSNGGVRVFDPDSQENNCERFRRGFWYIKVAKDKWKPKHRYIYEKHFGEIKDGNRIIFLDGDVNNFNIDNLIEITRGQQVVMNIYKLHYDNAELTRMGIQLANLVMKSKEAERKIKK